jgi:uncharacterized protein
MVFKPVRTPCMGVCSTGIGDSVCRGCKRFAHEVIDWNGYSQVQRYTIIQRLEVLLKQVVEAKIRVVDASLLKLQIQHQQIRFNPDSDPHCWVFELLKAGSSQIQDVSVFGLLVQPEWHKSTLTEVKDAIDQDFYTLSCAHFERYFGAYIGSSHKGVIDETVTSDLPQEA